MLDYEKYQSLHTIIMLKDVIRKWWRMELLFIDKAGQILDRRGGDPIPPQNDFCRLALFCQEGNRRCTQSLKVLLEKFRTNKKMRRSMFHECHLGFQIVGAPVYLNGEYEGAIFVDGFLRQPASPREAENLKAKVGQLNSGATDLDRALERIPILTQPEIDKLSDLLELAAVEVANYEAEMARHEETVPTVSEDQSDRYSFENIVGRSEPMQEIFKLLEKVCQSDSTVLVNGESGTGKELVARAIHYNGLRKDKPFVVQNCSAFNDNLLESALFGHVKGAFTGAVRDKKGLFEVADEGTFFLDEVGDMSPALQVKLLRVLQEGTFIPVGGTASKEVDVRVIAATHKDLAKLVEKGEFREDLFYRINVIRIQVPPLRDRKDDLPMLIAHFMRKHGREGMKCRCLAPEAMKVMEAYTWPGNIRELENEIERLLVLGNDCEILPAELLSSRIREGASKAPRTMLPLTPNGQLHTAVEALEREMIQQGLVRTQGNRSQLARELGISRSNLILKIEKYGLASASVWQQGAD